jgi:hypothetical protein
MQRLTVEKRRKNITKNLKEENDRATIRKSPRFNKATKN